VALGAIVCALVELEIQQQIRTLDTTP
jgi:hypothetical protein